MKLLFIQIGLWLFFILATAHVGVFLVPFGSLAGLAITILSPSALLSVKIACLLAGSICLILFIYGIKKHWLTKGILMNIAGLYLWCLFGYIALYYAY